MEPPGGAGPLHPTAALRERVAAILGWQPRTWQRVERGYTAAARHLVRNADRSAFVKCATTPTTAAMLGREIAVYRTLSGPFMPRCFGSDADADAPLLVIEDLSEAFWPPPWDGRTVEIVLEQLSALHGSAAEIGDFATVHGSWPDGWDDVASDPRPFLALGLVSPEWLRDALPVLREAAAACDFAGEAVCHFDLRSDNLCLTPNGARLIDWAEACRSNPRLDLGFWLPSLQFEGGPPPEDILPDVPEIAAWVAGYFAARAGLPDIPDAPRVRRVQREQLSCALPWAQRALGLRAF
jgi:hypothetical protein